MKKIVIIIKNDIFNTQSSLEGLRIALGITLSNKVSVSVILLGKSVFLTAHNNPTKVGMPDIDQSLELLEASGVSILADSNALNRYQIKEKRKFIIETKYDNILELINSSDTTLSF